MQPRLQLGPLEIQLFSWIQLHEKPLVHAREAAKLLGLSAPRATKLFSRLVRNRLAIRLLKGVYLVPTKLPPGGRWGPDPYLVLAQLMKAYGAQYQISGDDAFHRYGFSEQVPNVIAVYNTKVSGRKLLGGISYQLIKVDGCRLGAVTYLTLSGGQKIPFSSPGRALCDAIYDWSRFGTLPRAFDWIEQRIADKKLMRALLQAALAYGDMGCRRRLGRLLAEAGVSQRRLKPLRDSITQTNSYVPLVPMRPKRGKIDTTWGLVIND